MNSHRVLKNDTVPTRAPLVSLHGVTKAFGAQAALRQVELSLYAGQITALLGANGAGKSTLVQILSGVLSADEGRIESNGNALRLDSVAAARRAGILTVHQHICHGVAENLSVAENLLLDALCDPRAPAFIDRRWLLQRAAEVAGILQLSLPLARPMSELGQADRQRVILARTLSHRPKLLILDEPTASLSAQEAERLFALLERLRGEGVAILYISHRLADLQRLADRVLVLRDGRIVGAFDKPLDLSAAVAAMLGEALGELVHDRRAGGPPVLELQGARLRPGSPTFDLTLRTGEVVALTGLLGAGKSNLAEAIFGLRRLHAGRMTLDGRPWAPASPRQAIAGGVFMAAEDRARLALIPGFNLRQTMSLPFLRAFCRFGLLRGSTERAAVQAQIERLGIKAEHAEVGMHALSGGNQQKVVLGRWLLAEARLLIFDEPFQGVDIRARREIGRQLRDSGAGRATLVICSDLDEALEVADRILIVRGHGIVAEHSRSSVARATLVAQLSAVERQR